MNVFFIFIKNILLFLIIYLLPGYLFLLITLKIALNKLEILILSIPFSLTILSLLIFLQYFLLNRQINYSLITSTSICILAIESIILLIREYKKRKLH